MRNIFCFGEEEVENVEEEEEEEEEEVMIRLAAGLGSSG